MKRRQLQQKQDKQTILMVENGMNVSKIGLGYGYRRG
jgi:hypothetical protein